MVWSPEEPLRTELSNSMALHDKRTHMGRDLMEAKCVQFGKQVPLQLPSNERDRGGENQNKIDLLNENERAISSASHPNFGLVYFQKHEMDVAKKSEFI